MSSIKLKVDVTEFEITPIQEQEHIVFTITEKALIICVFDDEGSILDETEIEKKDAIELAKLILFKYK